MIKLSVIISVFNGEQYLAESLDSVLHQSFNDFELILIDDASKDQSRRIIEQYSNLDSRIIPIYNQSNVGLTANLNKGIKKARGELIGRMDADDVAFPLRFEAQISYLDSHPEVDLVGSSAIVIDGKGHELSLRSVPEFHKDILSMLPKANPVTHSTVIFRKDRFARISFYNENYPIIQDYEMWFRAIGKGLKFHNLQETLLAYRMDKNYIDRKSMNYRWCDFKLRIKSFKHIDLPFFKYYYALIPLILGLTPKRFYPHLKKTDPRVKNLD
ncbi:glycosyltransferase [Lutimonas zeaxanthinifaciens]|uniref:glycosyltransferase n=1 Tax=Lutimonas zeaxanthinifaciens TaxID=3060215 RepID=UPI00265D0CB8|nr:glycosyltransferase [Lutimonas sp. YSD2104]WKK66706.1 glycosyltransferase [Lutimonas sp. YSD2104]